MFERMKIQVSVYRSLASIMGVFLITLVILSATALHVSAQYVVKATDTLWGIAEKNTQPRVAWQQIYDQNKFLQEPGRRFTANDGRIIVLIKEGEILQGVNKDGLIPTPTATPTSSPTATPSPTLTPTPAPTPIAGFWDGFFIPWWIWMTIAIIAFLIALYFFTRWLVRQDLNWRRVMPNGANENTARNFFNQAANDLGGRVMNFSPVLLSGWWLTRHFGIIIPIPHRFNRERAYRGTITDRNGHIRTIYLFETCGNRGTQVPLFGARVEEGWGDESQTLPTPTPTVNPTQATATSTEDTQSESETNQTQTNRKVKFEYRPEEGDNQEMFRVKGADKNKPLTCEVDDEEITVRFSVKRD